MAGRKPLGPALVEHLEGSEDAKRRLELILATIGGRLTVVDAAQRLGISEAMFYKLRTRVLQLSLDDLEPKPTGRPPQLLSPEAARSAELAAQVTALERELTAQSVRLELAQTMPYLLKPATPLGAQKNESPLGSAIEESTPVAEDSVTRAGPRCIRQLPTRQREQRARQAAVEFVEQQLPSCRRAAGCLAISPRTLAHWRRRQARGELGAKPRGRVCLEPSRENRLAVQSLLEETGPRLGLPTLRAYCSEVRPGILKDLLRDYRSRFQQEHRCWMETLHWRRPGSVWAIDHSQPPRPIDGYYAQILAIRDLASGMQLAWTPVLDATAAEVLPVLESLVLAHGPPLVLKSDNGSAFRAEPLRHCLAQWQVEPLLSPVRMPRFNGSCEAGIGAAKRRTEYLAARHGRSLDWSANDLFAAEQWANEEHYPNGLSAGTPASRFAVRDKLDSSERDTFRAAVVEYERQQNTEACAQGQAMTDHLEAVHHRRAVRRALVELGYLDITRRLIPQPIRTAKCARIK